MTTTRSLWEVHRTGEGTISLFANKLSIMQNDKVHYEITDLLNKLRTPTRRAFVFDPPQHDVWRQRLRQQVNVAFDKVNLDQAIAQLAEQSQVEMRIDVWRLEENGDSPDEPVDYEMGKHPLKTVLDVMLEPLELNYILRDGALYITTDLEAQETMIAAVYDVRDICRNGPEARSLQRLVMEQTHGLWEIDGDGEGTIAFPKIGVMVVSQNEKIHDEILELLNRYRSER